jgi:hypothetical protein
MGQLLGWAEKALRLPRGIAGSMPYEGSQDLRGRVDIDLAGTVCVPTAQQQIAFETAKSL